MTMWGGLMSNLKLVGYLGGDISYCKLLDCKYFEI